MDSILRALPAGTMLVSQRCGAPQTFCMFQIIVSDIMFLHVAIAHVTNATIIMQIVWRSHSDHANIVLCKRLNSPPRLELPVESNT